MKITAPQRRLLLTLAEERTFPTEADKDRLLKALRISEDPEEFGMSKRDASRSIEWLLARPRADAPEDEIEGSTPITEPGAFAYGGEVYIVKPNRQRTRLYAKKVVEAPGPRLAEDGQHVPIDLEYAAGAMAFLREEHRLDTETAKSLSVRYGRCIVCGTRIRRAESVERGMGPVCFRRTRSVATRAA